jgi:parallel beta-helix repeat protein
MPKTEVGGGGTTINSGTLANRPAAGNADDYYWATDVYILYRDTGAAWEIVAENIETASFVIWTDGTTWYAKNGITGQIDFNGADPATVINNTLAAATAHKVTLLMHEDWTITTTISVPAGVHLSGIGWGYALNYNADGNCIEIDGDNVIVSDLKINITDGAGSGGNRPNGIYAANRANLNITRYWLIGDETVADDASDLRQCGIAFDTVTNSRISLCNSTGQRQHSISLKDSTYNTISVNNCNNNTNRGIMLDGGHSNTIAGNTCDHTDEGIFVHDSYNNTVTGNTCVANGSGIYVYGSEADDNTITGNTCNDNTLYGITVEAAGDNVVTGNKCHSNNDYGIRIYYSTDTTVTGNNCNNNSDDGIRIDNGTDNLVAVNTCHNNGGWGIYLTSTDRNKISNNYTSNNTSGSITVADVACDNNTVEFNTVEEGAPNDAGTNTRAYGNYDPSANAFVGDVGASPW